MPVTTISSRSVVSAAAASVNAGGASGADGDDEMHLLQTLIADLGVEGQVRFVEPQPHHILSTYYRAADVVIVPSRSESFGLVALEASAARRLSRGGPYRFAGRPVHL